MKIGIDARFWGPEGTGIGRYVKNLVLELEKIDYKNHYYILLRRSNAHLYQSINPNFQKIILDSHPYAIKSQFTDLIFLKKLKLDLIHFTHFSYPVFYSGRFIVTIHDLIKSHFYRRSASTRSIIAYGIKHLGYEYVVKKAIANSGRIITPSQFVKEEILKSYPVDEQKIIVIYEGAEDKFRAKPAYAGRNSGFRIQESEVRNEEDILKKYGLEEKKYLLYVGNVYPYKNVERLLEVIAQIRNSKFEIRNLTLAIVCSRSVFYDRLLKKIQEMSLVDNVKMLGYVPDEELVVLYEKALAFMTASLAEGFGITGLEAMAAGCPVICSHRSCLPEVYGEAALYFDPGNLKEIVRQIRKIKNQELRIKLIKLGYKQVNKYSWQKMAKEIGNLYKEVGRR